MNLRKVKQVDAEFEEIRSTILTENKVTTNNTLSTLFNSKYKYLVIAGLGVAAFQQFQGQMRYSIIFL